MRSRMPKKTGNTIEVVAQPPAVAFTARELDEIDKLVDELKKDAYVTRALAERIERLEKIVLHRKLRSKYETKPRS
jgi:ribosomal protein S13